MEKLVVKSDLKDIRIDKVIATLKPEMSRDFIIENVKNGTFLVNDKAVKPSYKAQEGDVVSIPELEAKKLDLEAKDLGLDIVYEDDDVAIVNKPKGLVVHPSLTSTDVTLVNGLLYELDDLSSINGVERPGIVHRIDKDTTGLLMVAKNDKASKSLTEQLKNHSCNRTYHALVYGVINEEKGRINAPIGRSKEDRKKMAVTKDGKEAITNFKVLKRFKDFTYIECRLETGRTHQIRVHLEYIGHPLVGDKTYGRRKVIGDQGQFLHAKTIGFVHPTTGKWMEFDSDIPAYFKEFMDNLE